MSTALRRDAHFQEIAFSTLAGFSDNFPFKNGIFLSPQKCIPLAWFGSVWPSSLVSPPLASLGLSLASPRLPLGLFWVNLGTTFSFLGVILRLLDPQFLMQRLVLVTFLWIGVTQMTSKADFSIILTKILSKYIKLLNA